MLDEPPVRPLRPPGHTNSHEASERSPGASSSGHRPRAGTDEISLTQAAEEYCASTNSDEESGGESPASETEGVEGTEPEHQEEPPPPPPTAQLFSGIYRGYVSLGRKNDQNYFDLEVDPNVDSSWFGEMIKPLEESDMAPYYPMQGANWGNVR